MKTDINTSISRLTRGIIAFDCVILIVLTGLVMMFSARSKQRLAEQFSEAFRTPLMAGDNRQVMLDMARPVSMDFIGFTWKPQNPDGAFTVPDGLGSPNRLIFQPAKVAVFFDENRRTKAGDLEFYYNRWAPVPAALAAWLFLVLLSITAGYREKNRMLREYALSLKSGINDAKANIAAQVAHDIRSPLVALDAALENTTALPEKQRTIVRHSLNRIRDVANSLLERNRSQQGIVAADSGERLEVRRLSSLIDPIVTEKRMQYASKLGIDIDFKPTGKSYGLFVAMQPVEFGRLLSNLVNNAVEALGDTGKVDVQLTSEDGSVLLSISDDGKGISPEVLARLGRKGETHGKAGGSGLGLFHARTLAESWGGNLTITSAPGKGTTVTIKLPKAETPAGFVAALELVPGRPVVILDDDKGIHGLWQKRLAPVGLGEHNIEVLYFSEPEALRVWAEAEPAKAKAALCLFDYELSGHKETGLSLAEELGLCPRTVLVSGRSEEKQLIEERSRLKVRSIPKSLLEFVPVKIGAPRQAVLIDDDVIVHMNWETAAEEAGIELKSYKDPGEFLAALGSFSKATPVYIDSELGVEVKGEDVAIALKEKGFTNLTLVTGYSPERFVHLSWLKVRGKESPWRA